MSAHDYAAACRAAALQQGLGAFLDRDGWIVEQTGGFTMVAVRYDDDHCWTVTLDGGGYLACRQTAAGWEEGVEPPRDAYRFGLTLDEALALCEPAS